MDIYLFYAHSFLIFTCLLCYGDCYKYVVNWGVRKSVIGNLFFTLFRYHYFKRGLVVPSSCLRRAFVLPSLFPSLLRWRQGVPKTG